MRKSAKTIPKTVLKTAKALNKRPNFRMFDVLCSTFFIRRAKLRASLARPSRPSAFCAKTASLQRKPPPAASCECPHQKWNVSNAMACRRFRVPCQSGSLHRRRTGRQARHGFPESPPEPSYEVSSAADEVAITRSTLERRRIDREIEENEDWFRERQRRQAAAEAVERQRIEAQQAEQRRLQWEQKWTQYALNSVPYDARREVEMEVHTMVSEALSVLQPSQPEAITQRLVDAAVHRALGPWTRKQEIERALKAGMNSLAWDVQFRAEYRAVETARVGRSSGGPP